MCVPAFASGRICASLVLPEVLSCRPVDVATQLIGCASRKNRKSITTWQDEVVLKELEDISHETGIPQQVLIAEGLNYILAKYRKRPVAR